MATDEKTEMTEAVGAFLKLPYTRLVVPEEDGTFRGEILEFPGCLATGDTPAETYSELESAAADWLTAAMERGQNIPEPFENIDFSGKFVLRLPKSLHKKSARLAERDGVSLNQFIVTALSECVGERVKALGHFTMNVSNVSARILNIHGAATAMVGFNTNVIRYGGTGTNYAPTTMLMNPLQGLKHA